MPWSRCVMFNCFCRVNFTISHQLVQTFLHDVIVDDERTEHINCTLKNTRFLLYSQCSRITNMLRLIDLHCFFFSDHPCWVRPDGSWFIQKVMDVFEQFYKDKHVEEMITVIKMLVANQRSRYKGQEVAQMPCKLSTLRKYFYL